MASRTHHPATEPHRQATEDEVHLWVQTGQRPRSSRKSSRVQDKDAVRPKSSLRKKQQAWADEPGPLQAVLDMHASAVEQLHHVSFTSAKLQEEFDLVREQFETAAVQTQFEESVLHNIEHSAGEVELSLKRIEDRVIQLIRQNYDQDDHTAMEQVHKAIEDQLRQEVQDVYDRNAKERKLAERVPDLLKDLDDHKEILDETVTERERYKLDGQQLQEKVRMITQRAENAEQMREQALGREAALVKRVDLLTEESSEQRKSIAKMTAEVKVANQLKADLSRFQKASADANKYLDEAVRGKREFEIEVEKLTDQLTESQSEVRELQLHIYQGDLETRGIRDGFQKLVETVELLRVQRQENAEAFAAEKAELQQAIASHEGMRMQETYTLGIMEASLGHYEAIAAELGSRIPEVLQNVQEELTNERLKKEMLEFKVEGLLTKFKTLQQELAEEKEKAAHLKTELSRNEQIIEEKVLAWDAAAESWRSEARILSQCPAIFEEIDVVLQKATALGSTMKASTDEAMAEVRGHLLAQQKEDLVLRDTITDLTNKLNRAQAQALNSDKAKAVAFSDRDAAKQLMWRAQEQEKVNEQQLKKEAARLQPLERLAMQAGDIMAVVDAHVARQRASEGSETEKVRSDLKEALAEKRNMANRLQELEEECSLARQDMTELERQHEAHRDQMSAAVAASLAQLAVKKDLVESLAGNSHIALDAAAEYQACASQVCQELLAQIELHTEELQSLKRRRKPLGKRRKSASPQKRKSGGHPSWAQLSVRTHENVMGVRPRSRSPGGHGLVARAGAVQTDGHYHRDGQELARRRARATSAISPARLPEARIVRSSTRVRAASAHGIGLSSNQGGSPAFRPRSPDGWVFALSALIRDNLRARSDVF